jgi:hypothetical protein
MLTVKSGETYLFLYLIIWAAALLALIDYWQHMSWLWRSVVMVALGIAAPALGDVIDSFRKQASHSSDE